MFNILIHRIVKNITSYQSCWKWLKLYNLLVSPPCHLNLKFNCSCDLTSTRDGKVNFGWADQVEEMLPWIEVKGQTDKLNNYCVYRWNGRKTIIHLNHLKQISIQAFSVEPASRGMKDKHVGPIPDDWLKQFFSSDITAHIYQATYVAVARIRLNKSNSFTMWMFVLPFTERSEFKSTKLLWSSVLMWSSDKVTIWEST